MKYFENASNASMLGSEISFSYPLKVERFMFKANATSSCVFERLFLRNFILVLKNIAVILKIYLTRIINMTNFPSQTLIKNSSKLQINLICGEKKKKFFFKG